MFSSLITKHINNRQKDSVHAVGLHDVTATVGKTPLAKSENLPTPKNYSMYTLNSVVGKVLLVTELPNVVGAYKILQNFKKCLKIPEFY